MHILCASNFHFCSVKLRAKFNPRGGVCNVPSWVALFCDTREGYFYGLYAFTPFCSFWITDCVVMNGTNGWL
nr:hypothetical protein Q903MT_gene1131 [Picea sitchensis]